MIARLPKDGTDNARMLDELRRVYPAIAWQCDSRLHMKANSRASDLRKLGWDVKWESRRDPAGGRKRQHGYRLATLPQVVQGDAPESHPEDNTGQLRIA